MPKLNLFLKTEMPFAPGTTVLSAHVIVTVPELLAQRKDSANCPILFLCFLPIELHSLSYYHYGSVIKTMFDVLQETMKCN